MVETGVKHLEAEIEVPRADGANAPASLRGQACARLRAMIADGRLRAGDRLTESHVARAFGISRSPAREALAMLAEDGLIAERHGRGYTVLGASEEDSYRVADLAEGKLASAPQWTRIYAVVEQEILTRVLLGSVQINDRRLAEHFGVSRTVTRDLLARMHGLGIIAKSETGKWIAEQVKPERIRHLFELRALLEPQALLKATPYLDAATIETASAHVARLLEMPSVDSKAFDRAEWDLHITILHGCPNREILRALRQAHLLFGPTRHLVDPVLGLATSLIEAALREHRDVLRALEAGAWEKAAARLHDHIEVAEERWMSRFALAKETSDLPLPPYLLFTG